MCLPGRENEERGVRHGDEEKEERENEEEESRSSHTIAAGCLSPIPPPLPVSIALGKIRKTTRFSLAAPALIWANMTGNG